MLTDNDLKSYIISYLADRKITYTRLDKHDRAIEAILKENWQQKEEIERLNKKYKKALELLADYNMPCEFEECKIPDDYCEENCDDDYKKCWNKYIDELKGDSSNDNNGNI